MATRPRVDQNSRVQQIFVSHKADDGEFVRKLVEQLGRDSKGLEFTLSEELRKGADWRADINAAIANSDFFFLIYTRKAMDWSWCLYEAGMFMGRQNSSKQGSNNLYCVHHPDVAPPDALLNLQSTRATRRDLTRLLIEFFQAAGGQTNAVARVADTSAEISDLFAKAVPSEIRTKPLRPFVKVFERAPTPAPDGQTRPASTGAAIWRNWDVPENLHMDSLFATVDDISASYLNLSYAPEMPLLELLRTLDADSLRGDAVWVERFLRSLQMSIEGRIDDQEVTHFRTVKGDILRPIIDSVDRDQNGRFCGCRVLFVDAFSSPPSAYPRPLLILGNGIRLAARTRIEVIDRFMGRMSSIYEDLLASTDPADQSSKKFLVGAKLLGALSTIVSEGDSQGLRRNDDPLPLFDGRQQEIYVSIRTRFNALYAQLRTAARREDEARRGTYVDTEAMLKQLLQLQRDYLSIALPRFQKLLTDGIAGIEAAPP